MRCIFFFGKFHVYHGTVMIEKGGTEVEKFNNELSNHFVNLTTLFKELFTVLDNAGYCWSPLIPERLIKHRGNGGNFCKLQQYFGLGIHVDCVSLKSIGLSEALIEKVTHLQLAISRLGRYYVPHNHWHRRLLKVDDYVHFGQESLLFIYQLYRHWKNLKGKKILDIGCSGGALALELGQIGNQVLGLDRSKTAVEWALASAFVQNSKNTNFIQLDIAEDTHSSKLLKKWDIAVFNPPMIIPRKNQILPHRDGGEFGLHVPFRFVEFSYQCLTPSGEIYCLMTNPIRNGKSLLFEKFSTQNWTLLEAVCLNKRFNHQHYSEENYKENKISRVELFFIHMKKN